jgi:LuxR family maltose regulon positive regulatory protein
MCQLDVAHPDATQAMGIGHRLLDILRDCVPHLRPAIHAAADTSADRKAILHDLERRGGWKLIDSLPTMREHLRGVDAKALGEFPRMRMALIWLMCKDDRLPEAKREWREFLRDVVQQRYPALPLWEVGLTRELVADYAGTAVTAMRFRRVEQLYRDIPLTETLSRAHVYNGLCFMAIEAQQMADARRYGRLALDLYAQAESPLDCLYMHYHLGMIQARCGHPSAALREYARGIGMARSLGNVQREMTAIGEVLSARSHYLCNRLMRISRHLDAALDAVEQSEGWHLVFWFAYRVQIDLAALEPGAAALSRALLRARNTAQKRGFQRLEVLIGLHEIEIDLRHGRANAALRHAHALGLASIVVREAERDLAWRETIQYARYLDLLLRAPDARAGERAQAQALVDDTRILEFFTLHIRALLLRAQIDFVLGAVEAACAGIDAALALILPERPLRIALDHPDMLSLIRTYRRAVRHHRAGRDVSRLAAEIERLALAEARQSQLRERRIVLSRRELDLIRELAAGLRNKEIAQRLKRSENTVKFHLKRLNAKFGTRRRGELLARARDAGLLD